jgi:anaerobic glycerol-3-phosphate dehydrogenase
MTPLAAPVAPAAAPTYTLDALAKAGATLAQSGKMQEALGVLARFGVQTVNQLKPEQYGAFATELRALGAQL